MNNFSSILTSLRKERKLSQKKVSQDLNISQALLSHYEKGIRECSLDLLITIADYYGVSCDYLLGCTDIRVRLKSENQKDSNGEDKPGFGNICNCINDIVSSVRELHDDKLIGYVENYIILSSYRLASALNLEGIIKNDGFKLRYKNVCNIVDSMQRTQIYNILQSKSYPSDAKVATESMKKIISFSEKFIYDTANDISNQFKP